MSEKICPKCHNPSMKTWDELSAEQKMLVEKLPQSAALSFDQRRRNLFCPRCWHEQTANFNEFC